MFEERIVARPGRHAAGPGRCVVGAVLGLAGMISACIPTPEPAADALWDLSYPPTFRVTIPADNWEQALWDILPPAEDECAVRPYLEGSVDFENPQTGQTESYDQVGIRWRGRSAINEINPGDNKRAGLKLGFNTFAPGREFHGMRKVNLLGTEGDQSQMREFLGLGAMRAAGVPAPRTNYAELFVNDRYMGIYPLTEEADDQSFLNAHFDDPDGLLFKVNGYCGGGVDWDWDGDSMADYEGKFDPKAGTDAADFDAAVVPLLECINERGGLVFEDCIHELIDVDEVMAEIAVDVSLPDPDGMVATGKNFMLYRDPSTERFVVYSWDKDLSFDTDDFENGGWTIFGEMGSEGWFSSRLADKLIEAYPDAYCDKVLEVSQFVEPSSVFPYIDQRRDFMQKYVDREPFQEASEWTRHIDNVKEAISFYVPQVIDQAHECDY